MCSFNFHKTVFFWNLLFYLTDNDGYNAHDIRRSVREAALSKPITNSEPHKSISNDASDFFMPLTSRSTKERSVDGTTPPNLRKHRLVYPSPKGHTQKASVPDRTRGFDAHDHQRSSLLSLDDSLDQVFSPPLLMESNLFPDTYEDLLGMFVLQSHILAPVIWTLFGPSITWTPTLHHYSCTNWS